MIDELTMRLGQIVLAGVTDVQDVSDAKRLDDMGITGVVPVAKIQTRRKNLIWVVLGPLPKVTTDALR